MNETTAPEPPRTVGGAHLAAHLANAVSLEELPVSNEAPPWPSFQQERLSHDGRTPAAAAAGR
ncbi:MAG: hypothetical protein HYX53_09645 [Chloroflexi bacterium]|nr:hypothetical protein [Chloroflexota bacterium]